MFGLTDSTPSYKGSAQPQADSGGFLSGVFGYLFGGKTPAYKGNGQPTAETGWLGSIFSNTPVYKSAPVVTQTPTPPTAEAPALSDGCPPPDGTSPQIYVCIPQ
jgi:hypothetical protein